MSLLCARASPTCHSYVLVRHRHVTRMCSCIIRVSSVYHPCVLVCHPYVTRLWFYHEPGQTLVFVGNGALQGGFHFLFWGRAEHLAIILHFEVFLIFHNFPCLKSIWESCGNSCICHFNSNNRASFHLWKENLLHYQKVSKYYEHDCSHIKWFYTFFYIRKKNI